MDIKSLQFNNNNTSSPAGGGGRNSAIPVKTIVLAVLLFCVSPFAMAAGADSDVTKLGIPTLDTLAGQEIPDGDGAVYPNSGYTLTPVTPADTSNLDDNVIVKYEIKEVTKYYDPQTGLEVAEADKQEGVNYREVVTKETLPHYYEVNLAKTEYGRGANKIYFNWENNSLTEGASATGDNSIIYSYDETGFSNTVSDQVLDKGTTTDPSGSSSSYPTTIEGGAGVNNPLGTTITIDNTLYKNNVTQAVIESTTNTTKYAELVGGAVHNKGTISGITGQFINNGIDLTTNRTSGYLYSYANGGAIGNQGEIGDITANFIGNYVKNTGTGSEAYGGAIYNYNGTIGDITGDFIGNFTSSGSSYAYGGAIYNSGTNATIGEVTGDFIGNYAQSASTHVRGGAIYNYNGTIGDITGDFIGNYAKSSGSYETYGGAIYNYNGTIGDITGDFIGNFTSSGSSYAYGGAIYNYGSSATIGNITGDFIENYASGKYAYGGAIYNEANYGTATIGDITGDFIGNYASSGSNSARGGAIYNATGSNATATIDHITGDFIGNYASASSKANGGAIYNSRTITSITGDFIGNYSQSSRSYAEGGAIDNFYAEIGEVTGDFIGNYAQATGSSAYGGAIYNEDGTIGGITGDFIGNYTLTSGTSSNSSADGGAIYNSSATIGEVTGDFIGNYSSGSGAYGGAIYNVTATIGDITGDFIGNYAQSKSGVALGGAIYNYIYSSSYTATIGLTNNSFLNNYATSETGTAKGGAIFTNYDLTLNADNGTALISGNYTESNGVRDNNAIYVANLANSSGTIQRKTTLTLNAVNNGKIQIDDKISGGSYYQSSNKFWETADHAYNLALTGDGTGTISLYDDVTNANVTASNVTVDFANGVTNEYDFVSMTDNGGTKYNIDVDLTNNIADTISTQQSSTGTIKLSLINFIGEYLGSPITVQILKTQNDNLQLSLSDNIITIPDIDNTVYNDQIIAEAGAIELATTNTTNDSITIKDKIYDTLDIIAAKVTGEDRNFNFRTADNYMLSKDLSTVSEGTLNINGLGVTTPSTINAQSHTLFDLQNATTLNIKDVVIDNSKDFAINAENANAVVNLTNTSIKNTAGAGVISNVDLNVTADGGKSEFSGNNVAFDIKGADKTLTLNAINEGEITLSDEVKGASGFKVKFTGDDKSKININNNITNANLDLENTNLYLSKEDLLNNSLSLTLNSGSINLQNNAIGVMHLPTLNLNGTTNLSADVDLLNETMDRITADNYTINPDAILNVKNLNLLSTTEKETVTILFADEQLAGNVQFNGESPLSYKGTNTAYSPIYKYDVSYGINQDDGLGYFTFNRAGGGSSNPSDAFSPPVLAEPVAAQSGGKAVVNETLRFAFQHADNFSILPSAVRMSAINQNKYAINDSDVAPQYAKMQAPYRAGFWVKPFTTFESMDLKNGPDVDAVTYGTLIGFDSQFRELGHGWHGVTSGYVGYNGSSLSYSGVDTYMNGGLAGVTETLYKGNFFTALTVTAGASAGTTSSSFGSEDFAMLLAGIGSKTGYNFEFKEGRYIIQPSMFINYSFINTFDYTNAAGVRIDSDPVHSLQLNPTIRFIANLPNKWQPYASVGMVWNVLNSSRVTANDVVLPRMSVKPYVEYGVGVQRTWADKFTAFFQAMIRNGGRTGVALTGGFRWTVGEDEPIDSVELNTPSVNYKASKNKSQYKRNVEEIQVKSITLPDEDNSQTQPKKFSWAFGE